MFLGYWDLFKGNKRGWSPIQKRPFLWGGPSFPLAKTINVLTLKATKVQKKDYRVSQHVWDRLNTIFWSSEVCQQRLQSLRKNVFCSIKLLFKPFLWTAKRQMEFLGNFFPKILCSNLFSKLFEIGEKWL